jgi:hypothetical protein
MEETILRLTLKDMVQTAEVKRMTSMRDAAAWAEKPKWR